MRTDIGLRSIVGRFRPALLLMSFWFILSAGFVSPADADPVAPRTELISGEVGRTTILTRKVEASFRFRSDAGTARFECSLDGRPWRSCGKRSFRRTVEAGRHRFRVRAVGADGMRDPTPAVRTWRVVRWRPDLTAAARYAASREGRVSFSVDLGWRTWGRSRYLQAPMASTVKAMLMVAYLRKRKVRGRELSLYERELLAAMIRYSDNYSANTVASMVGPDRMRALARAAGLRGFEYSTTWGLSRMGAADQARFMRVLPVLIPERHRSWGLGLMARITGTQRWGIPKVRPTGWKLFFKGGWGISDGRFGGTVNHQMALLTRGSHRVGVAILTQGNPSSPYGEKTLREVGRRLLRGLSRVHGS